MTSAPLLPDYSGACISNVIPALLGHAEIGRGWMPEGVEDADQVVLLVIDGLGWDQLQTHAEVAPVLASLSGGPISTVVPSTTATALTSLTTGAPPGEHGVVGYRIRVDGSTLNVLRWTTEHGDARNRIVPSDFQTSDLFLAQQPAVISRSEFHESGFTSAHLDTGNYVGYRTTASMIHEVTTRLHGGDRFVYAYYDGLDRIGHEYGHGGHYLAELAYVDAMVEAIRSRMPDGAALLITADHGQVVTGNDCVEFDNDVLRLTNAMSGEARFRWLHARPGRTEDLLAAARDAHGHQAWVEPVEAVVDGGWLGPQVCDAARARLGDVAVVPHGVRAFVEPADMGRRLIGRHGSLTAAEMRVPLLLASR